MRESYITPDKIKIRGRCVHNLKNIDVDIPLNQTIACQLELAGKITLGETVLVSQCNQAFTNQVFSPVCAS